MQATIQATNVFERNYNATSRIIVNQGGTRSSKTYSIAQVFIVRLLQSRGRILSIVRKSLPSLKYSVMMDFFEILDKMKYYHPENHNKTENTYVLNGNLVQFLSLDQPQKKRGAKRNYLWLNEANEFNYEDYLQLAMRTTDQIVLDFNPSDEFHWIYDNVITRDDCTFIQSTYKDNPFLEQSIITEIERLRDTDENYWRIYGLGERGRSESKVYSNWSLVDEMPEKCDEYFYGLDFGFNNPTSLVRVGLYDKEIYVDEIIYQSHLTNSDLIEKMKDCVIDGVTIKADCAEPDRISELRRAGFSVSESKKGKNSVNDGIDQIKRTKMFVTKRSVNVIKELKSYQWKQNKDGQILDEPVKFNDHAMDAIRYAVYREEGANIRWL